MAQGAPTIHNTNDQPYFYPRLIEPPVVENYTDQTLYRRDYDMWARTGGYDSYIPDLIGLKASVDELNTLVGVNTSTTVQAQLNLRKINLILVRWLIKTLITLLLQVGR